MILIGGYPRSGTTLLMTIFHKYGLDIGYTDEKVQRVIENNEGALEWFNDLDFYREIDKAPGKAVVDRWGKTHTLKTLGLKDPNTYPDVIKHPGDWQKQRSIFEKIDFSKCKPPHHAIFCSRNEADVVKSMQKRRKEYRKYNPDRMTYQLLNMNFNFLRDAEYYKCKWNIMKFPTWAIDSTYFWTRIMFLGLNPDKLMEIYNEMVKKERINYGLAFTLHDGSILGSWKV